MGELAKLGWQRMDVLVEAHGADDVLHMVCEQVADGATLSDISRREGVPYSVLWKWLGVGDRMAAYKSALEAKADLEAHRMLEIADGSTPESVVVDKLRTDVRKHLTSKWGRGMYGDEKGGGGGGVTVVVNRGGVLQIGVDEEKGYQVDAPLTIDGEVI